MTRCPDCGRERRLTAYREGRMMCADCLATYYGQRVYDNDEPELRALRDHDDYNQARKDGLL